MDKIEVYIDGAVEPINPGGTASIGVYILKPDGTVLEDWGVIGSGPEYSNNLAEYAALARAFKLLQKHFNVMESFVEIFSDSQLVVNQMKRKWSVHSGLYFDTAQICLHQSTEFPNIAYTWIPRERNIYADELTKRALREVGIEQGGFHYDFKRHHSAYYDSPRHIRK